MINMRHTTNQKDGRRSAFTLIELLVVISIILLASSIIFIGGDEGGGPKLSSSQRIVSGIAQGARGQAILKNATTRLIIYSDDNEDEEKKLRFIGIVYAVYVDDDNDPNTASVQGWQAATQGSYLPEGIYFNEDLSASNDWSSANSMVLEYPRKAAQTEGSGDEFFYYEFNSNGTMATDFDNDWLVLQGGSLKPGSGSGLEVDFSEDGKKNLKAALIFRRTGTTTLVKDPKDIN